MILKVVSRLLPVALTLVTGCGSGNELLQVTGTIKNADGSAVAAEQGGTVQFMPIDSGRAASGGVEKDGTFTMMTEKPGDGMKPGKYKVVLQIWKDYRAGTLTVPKKYSEASTTPLEATVDADNTHFDFVVEP